jgi:hypothetical protein
VLSCLIALVERSLTPFTALLRVKKVSSVDPAEATSRKMVLTSEVLFLPARRRISR